MIRLKANKHLLWAMVSTVVLMGCVSGTVAIKGYEDISREKAAILLATGLCTPNWVFSLDLPDLPSVRASHDICGLEGCMEFILPSGRYHIYYRCNSHLAKGSTSVEFEVVELEAGHQYEIDFRGWFSGYHAVLIDKMTGKVVSQERK